MRQATRSDKPALLTTAQPRAAVPGQRSAGGRKLNVPGSINLWHGGGVTGPAPTTGICAAPTPVASYSYSDGKGEIVPSNHTLLALLSTSTTGIRPAQSWSQGCNPPLHLVSQ